MSANDPAAQLMRESNILLVEGYAALVVHHNVVPNTGALSM